MKKVLTSSIIGAAVGAFLVMHYYVQTPVSHAQVSPSINNRFTLTFTVTTSGTPFRISKTPLKADRLMIQAWPAAPYGTNTGTVSVYLGVPSAVTCAPATANQIAAKLQPGSSMSDPQGATGNSISEFEDLSLSCLDSTANGDVISVTGWRH